MIIQIRTRAIYQLPELLNGFAQQWLRIRVGDIDCNGNSKCTISYRKKSKDEIYAEVTKLETSDYYEAMHMFDVLGFRKSSEQETLRTKVVCVYEDIKYTIAYDIWPGLEHQVFLTIYPGGNAEDTDVSGFMDLINIEKYAMNKLRIDVDAEYNAKFHFEATFMPNIRFENIGDVIRKHQNQMQ